MAPPAPIPRSRRRSISRGEFLLSALVGVIGVGLIFFLCWTPKPPARPTPAPLVKLAPPPPPPRLVAPPAPPDVLIRANLIGPASAVAGGVVTFRWTGPDNPEDFVTLVKPDTPTTEYAEVHQTKTGPMLQFTVPDEPGPVELRYVAGRAKQILGRALLRVLPMTAEITAPSHAILGSQITVNWHGPNRPGDFLTIVASGASADVTETVMPVSQGSPVEMTVPEDPGDAEIRYLTKSHKILGYQSLAITIPVTAIFAPDAVKAGTPFEVKWQGPDNPADAVTLVPQGTPDGKLGRSVPTSKGSPLTMRAPHKSGHMELRYVTGVKALVLSRRPIRIRP